MNEFYAFREFSVNLNLILESGNARNDIVLFVRLFLAWSVEGNIISTHRRKSDKRAFKNSYKRSRQMNTGSSTEDDDEAEEKGSERMKISKKIKKIETILATHG